MPSRETDSYIPYLATAEAITEVDDSPDLFLRSLFPDATFEQVVLFRLYTLGKLHDGIMLGLEVTGHDPIGEIEAYQQGIKDGQEHEGDC